MIIKAVYKLRKLHCIAVYLLWKDHGHIRLITFVKASLSFLLSLFIWQIFPLDNPQGL